MKRPFYSVTFGDKNSWDEWALIPVKAGKIEFATPQVKYESIDVPGSDNVIDTTEVLTGRPRYNPRAGTLVFRFFDNKIPARKRFNSLKNYLNGRWMRAVIEDEPDYYYEGRFMVGDAQPAEGNWQDVEISYILNAYKLEVVSSTDDWLWDPFSFYDGIIRNYKNIELDFTIKNGVSDPITYTVEGSPMPVPLTIQVNEQVTFGGSTPHLMVTYKGVTYNLYKTGLYTYPQVFKFPTVMLDDGENELIFSITECTANQSIFNIDIPFRGGSL